MIYYIVFVISVFISSVSQIILKKSANLSYTKWYKEYLNLKVIMAYGMFFLSSLLTIYSYKEVPLSMGPVIEATGYFWVAILSWIFLKEKIVFKKGIGLLLIIIGVVIFGFS